MIVFFKEFLHFLYCFLKKIGLTFKLIFHPNIIKGESYYPEYLDRRKNKWKIWFDQLQHVWKYHAIDKFYYLFGFDIKGLSRMDDYVDNTYFIYQRSKLNNDILHAPIAVLRDKYLFSLIAEGAGIPVPKTIGLIDDGLVVRKGNDNVSIVDYLKTAGFVDLFIKSIDGECGDGVFHVKSNGNTVFVGGESRSEQEVLNMFSKGRYLIQEKITQHEKINTLFSHSINTIRLVTVYNKKENKVEVFSVGLRIGAGNNDVDNWAMGGLFVGIGKKTGKLKKYGFYKPSHGTKAITHPDTGVIFEGYQIPFYSEAIIMAKKFHLILRGVHSIGWDIAICNDGPCFIEGNDNWEISLMQVVDNGLKREFDRLF